MTKIPKTAFNQKPHANLENHRPALLARAKIAGDEFAGATAAVKFRAEQKLGGGSKPRPRGD